MRTIKLSDLVKDDKNFNKGTEYGTQVLKESIEKYGAGRSILIDKNGKVIAGNKTLQAAVEAGQVNDNVLLIETDGKDLVAVQRSDLDLDSDITARELAFVDNRASEVGLNWDYELVGSSLDNLEIPGMTEGFKLIINPDFEPGTEGDQGQLDKFDPKLTSCPHCGKEVDLRAQ